ncbi:MAG: ATP-binding protein [Nitrosotalea sp.]
MENNNHNKNNNILNPFVPQHPAQSQFFAGRKSEIDDFRKAAFNSAKLYPPTPINYAILGTWGMGKTSLLYEFKQIALEELKDTITCTSFFSALSPQSCRTWDDFSNHFLRNVRSTMAATEGIRTKIMEEIKKWDIELNTGVISAKREKDNSSPDFLESLENLWKKHLEPQGTEIAFVFLDDLHYFPIKSDDSSYLNLRTTFQELVHRGCNYSLVVTAPTGLLTAIAESAEPMIRFFTQFNLAPFTLAEAKEGIRKRLAATQQGIAIDDDVVESIVEKTQGHPYFVMFVMFELLSKIEKVKNVNLKLLEQNWPKIRASLFRTVFEQKFKNAAPKERELLVKISKTGSEVVSASDFPKFKGANTLFSRLEESELLLRKERGEYSIFHPLFSEYLQDQ